MESERRGSEEWKEGEWRVEGGEWRVEGEGVKSGRRGSEE